MNNWINRYRSKINEFEALASWADGYKLVGVAEHARAAARKLLDEITAYQKAGSPPADPIVINHG